MMSLISIYLYNSALGTVVPDSKVSIGIDPSFGSSKFGIVATRFVNERIEVKSQNTPDANRKSLSIGNKQVKYPLNGNFEPQCLCGICYYAYGLFVAICSCI
jgi:hypothetical protein